MSQIGVLREGGGGVLFHALVKFPLVEIWSIFYYLDVSPEIYFRKSDRYDRDLSFLTDKKLCDRTDLHQSAFGVTVITLVAITGVVCLFTSQIRITLEIMEKNLCRFRDIAGGECGSDSRARQTNVKLSSCNRA